MADDLLKPEEIEALLKAAGAGASGGEPKPAARSSEPGHEADLKAGIPSSAARAGQGTARGAAKTPTERLLEQAEAGLAAAVSPSLQSRPGIPSELGSAAPYEFEAFDQGASAAGDGLGLNALQDVELDLRIELGRAELLIEEVLQLKSGSVVPLDKLAGDPVDILVNGRLVARGEVLVLNDNFCVRVAEIVAPAL
ncbi:MAG TPA: flagellar motor switch protein FliN [Planctomycetaceae bacterium]|jgi:flagellar motor switch protein FliN/FliY|nr:flagellar motor switch protein FliN [Planctomycetaceae bacterium]